MADDLAPLRVGACLSLSGKYSRFGVQAANALQLWRAMDGGVELTIEDDESSTRALEVGLLRLTPKSDVLLGPYSTQLMRRAGHVASDSDRLIWNHGGSGDDVENAYPGHVLSVPTPTSQYAAPFLEYLAGVGPTRTLAIIAGKGSFGRQVAAGAERIAATLGIGTVRFDADRNPRSFENMDLFTVGQFEHDVETVQWVLACSHPPDNVCAVAAGVHEFGEKVGSVAGIFGIAQWFPGSGRVANLGPTEGAFLSAYPSTASAMPDYPAIQAVAGAALAVHAVRTSGGTARELVWRTAVDLDTATLYGDFKVDATTGAQVKHKTTLVRWTGSGLVPAR